MLVLSRKIEEEIMIGDDVKVRILKIKGNSISIGIEAPKEKILLEHGFTIHF